MNTFKFNTEDTSAKNSEFPYPEELREEDKFLAQLLTEIAPCVRTLQAQGGGQLSEERKAKLLGKIKQVFEEEKK